ncbi:MAG: acyl-CoA carboxylase subunit beta [Clostridia bacterium]|jgi:acetyl-CoA carboxylase carboxyltransferase component|nr:acyl-CoA carboxylase subunit beta [Clostridia bacterium]
MNTSQKIFYLQEYTQKIRAGGGTKAVEKQHSEGKLTVRERIEKLLDPDTFMETDIFVKHRCTNFGMQDKDIPSDGVVTGFGKIDNRPVCLYGQDFTVIGGTLGRTQGEKICKLMDLAVKIGIPIVGLLDSAGARIQEGVDAMYGHGSIFYRNTLYSGVIPQISAIMGSCAGGASYSPALTDFIFMVKDTSKMFITGPEVIKAVTGELLESEELGGAMTHNKISGVAHFAAENEEECLAMIKKLLSYIPSNNREKPPRIETEDSIKREEESLNTVTDERGCSYDMQEVIKKIVDKHDFFQTMPYYAPNMLTGFARIGGESIGIIANQPKFKAGCLDIDASDKATHQIRFCNSFNIPLVNFVDSIGFIPEMKQECNGLIRHSAKVLYAYAEATVPKITVVIGKAYSSVYLAMCPHELGADQVLAWPTAEIALEQPRDGVDIDASPYLAASRGMVDMVIEPKKTRVVLSHTLQNLLSKSEKRPLKKHGNMPM